MRTQNSVGSRIVSQTRERWESHRRTAGWLNVGFGLIVGLPLLVVVTNTAISVPNTAVFVSLGIPLLHVVGGVGVQRGPRWLRIPLWVVSVVDLVAFPIGSLLGSYNLWVLYNTRASAGAFRKEPAGDASSKRVTSVWEWLAVLGVMVIVVVYGMGRHLDQEREEVRHEVDAIADVLDSSGVSQPDLNQPIPTSEAGRMMWAVRMSLSDLFGFYRTTAASHGFDIDATPPDDWLASKYLANATQYSAVRVYFAKRLESIEDVHPQALLRLEEFARQRIIQVGLNSAQVIADLEAAVAKHRAEIETIDRVEEEFVRASLRLHDFLVKVDSRVDYDETEDIALFHVDEELSTVNQLLANVDDLSVRLDSLREASAGRAGDLIDRWGSPER